MAQRSFQVAVVDTCHCKRNFRKFRDFFKQANDRIGCKLFTCDVTNWQNRSVFLPTWTNVSCPWQNFRTPIFCQELREFSSCKLENCQINFFIECWSRMPSRLNSWKEKRTFLSSTIWNERTFFLLCWKFVLIRIFMLSGWTNMICLMWLFLVYNIEEYVFVIKN